MSHDSQETAEPVDPAEELSDDDVPSDYVDAGITIAVVVSAIALFAHTATLQGVTLGDTADPGPAFWPRIVLAIVFVTGMINLGLVYRRLRADGASLIPEAQTVTTGIESRFADLTGEQRRFYLTIALMVGYLLALDPLGYLTTTPAFLFLFAWINGYEEPLKLAVTSAGVSFLIYVGFRIYMNIALPYGNGPFRAFHVAVENLF